MEMIKETTMVDEFDVLLAQDKMMAEMSEEHSNTEDIIHNYLCDAIETDAELLEGVLKQDRNIKGAINYINQQAYKLYAKRTAAGVEVATTHHEEVFSWVKEYFILEEIEEEAPVACNIQTSTYEVPEHIKKRQAKQAKENAIFGVTKDSSELVEHTTKKEVVVDGQLDMFADLFGGEE